MPRHKTGYLILYHGTVKVMCSGKLLAYYCLDMFIWSHNAQSNTFNNNIMVNFQDI